VSGIVIVPAGQAPAGGWPIVAWAHPTTGVVPRCAPSLAIFLFQQIAGSRRLLEDGYAIAATDYPGLGTPGPHPYLVGESEARAVIDSVRAARLFPGLENSNRFAVWGHSQGGQASLFTGMIAKTYAPELQLVGVAAAAPATDLATLVRPAVTHAYMQRLCKAGSMVKMLDLPNVSHGFAGYDSADAAVDWIADRFGGRAKPNDC
jgi:acetyl esterase/lipase